MQENVVLPTPSKKENILKNHNHEDFNLKDFVFETISAFKYTQKKSFKKEVYQLALIISKATEQNLRKPALQIDLEKAVFLAISNFLARWDSQEEEKKP